MHNIFDMVISVCDAGVIQFIDQMIYSQTFFFVEQSEFVFTLGIIKIIHAFL